VVGAGAIGEVHARAYRQLDNVELIGVADVNVKRADAVANQVNCSSFYEYEALIDAGLDIVSVCPPPNLHLPIAERAAAAGVHIMMEKPMARTLGEADQMLAVCRAAGVRLMVGFTHRFYPEMQAAKRVIESGVIGNPLTVLETVSIRINPKVNWNRNREIAGGGALMTNASHGFDRVSWLLGQKITAIAAMVESSGESRTEDFGSALVRFDRGAQYTFFQHWGFYPTLMIDLHLFGEEGKIHVRSWDSIEVTAGNKQTLERFYYAGDNLYDRTLVGMVRELQEMVDAVRENRAPSPSGEDGRRALRLVLTAYQASETQSWIQL
jgi:predicted dehydrogenase